MIVIKYNDSEIKGFNIKEFWLDIGGFSYVNKESRESHTIQLDTIREVLVDGVTIYQREVV